MSEYDIRRLTQPTSGALFLGDLEPISAAVGWGELFVNQGYDGHNRVKILDEPHSVFLFAHSPSKIVYSIPSGIRRFTAVGAGLDHPETEHDWQYFVYLDGKLVHESPHHEEHREGLPIDVSIPHDSRIIILRIVSGHEGKGLANTCWGFPYFSR